MLSKTIRPSTFKHIAHRFIRGSPILSWRLPSSLNYDELNKELMLRNIKSSTSWEQSISLLEEAINAKGGYDNGLTTDPKLEKEKLNEEAKSNQINSNQYFETSVFAKRRHQLHIKKQFSDINAITFKTNSTVKITGTYKEVCRHRRNIIDALASSKSEETMFSFSGKMISDVMEHVKKVPNQFGVHCSVLRILANGETLYIASLSGSEGKRQKACTSFEELFDKLKKQARQELVDVIMMGSNMKTLARKEAKELKSTQLEEFEWYKNFV